MTIVNPTDIDLTTVPPTTIVHRATPRHRRAVNRVLASAFLDDPVFAWIVPDRARLEATIEPVFAAFADAFARHDETHLLAAGGVTTGAVMLAPPGADPVHPDDEPGFVDRVVDLLPEHVDRFGTCMERFEAVHPHDPAWYVQFVGVERTQQGRGFGSRLLRMVTDRADVAGEAAYLEATSERNRALYERHGFECIHEIPLPDGPTSYGMWRNPRH
jgi:ribosomal protein S18 acetylase RimI-like enzyme